MEALQKLNEVFKAGQKYTIYRISEMTAMTTKTEIAVKRLVKRNQFSEHPDCAVFVPKRKRKEYILPFESRAYQSAPLKPFVGAVFEGWEQPIKCDTESGSGVMRGNACYNFLGGPTAIRQWIENNQLNPYFEKASVVAITNNSICGESAECVVFPECVEPGKHAVIDRLLTKTA